jgi:hypothetical protein
MSLLFSVNAGSGTFVATFVEPFIESGLNSTKVSIKVATKVPELEGTGIQVYRFSEWTAPA